MKAGAQRHTTGQALMSGLGIGNTPLIDLPDYTESAKASQFFLKAEYLNPFGSVKDRTAAYLVAWALELRGRHTRLVESTSGNLGISLTHLCAESKLPPPVLVLDTSVPLPKVTEMRELGAEVIIAIDPQPGMDLRQTRIAIAEDLGRRRGHLWVNQYANEANVLAHAETTGPEIARALPHLSFVVVPVSTGGTSCGIAQYLATACPDCKVIAVEPLGSTIFGGFDIPFVTAGAGMRGPPPIVRRHRELLAGFAKVPDQRAAQECKLLNELHGLALGLTSGAAFACAKLLPPPCGPVVVLAPDSSHHHEAQLRNLLQQDPTGSKAELYFGKNEA